VCRRGAEDGASHNGIVARWRIDDDVGVPFAELGDPSVKILPGIGEKIERSLVFHEHRPFGRRTLGVSVNKQRSPVPPETSGQVNGGRCLPRSSLEIGDSKSHMRHL